MYEDESGTLGWIDWQIAELMQTLAWLIDDINLSVA